MKTKAAVLSEMGKPAPYAQSKPLVIEDLELEAPGPGEVLVEVAAGGLCHSDLSVIDGSRPRVMPMVLGHEASGIVRELGPNVTQVKPGDHVIFSWVPVCGHCIPCVSGRASICDHGNAANIAGTLLTGTRRFQRPSRAVLNHHSGVSGFSQFTVSAQESLVKIDPALSLETAALFGCAVVTGVGAVVNTAKVEPGTAVAVFGMGGVGLSAIMGARLAGAHPIIALDLLDHKLALAKEVGATHLMKSKSEEVIKEIRDLTHGGVHYAFEAAGNEIALSMAYESTRRGGQTVSIGLPHPNKRFSLAPVKLVFEERILRGSYMGSAVPQRDLPRYISLYQAGKLPVDKLFSKAIRLEEINAGFDALAKGEAVRQVVTFK